MKRTSVTCIAVLSFASRNYRSCLTHKHERSYAYRDANCGYNGYHVDRDDYSRSR